jgi:ATP-binding cassette, subfamily B, bacterial MsbA
MNFSSRSRGFVVLLPFLKTYLWRYRGQLSIAFFFMILAAAATASFARLLQPILDKAMIGVQQNPQTVTTIIPLALLILLSFIVRGLATYTHTTRMNWISQNIVADIQRDVFSHFMNLDLGFFHKHPSGQLVSRVTNDVNVMRAAVSDVMTGLGANLLTLIFLVAVMFNQDAHLATAAFIIFPFAAFLVMQLGRRLRKISRTIQAETAGLMSILIQIFQGIRQVQAYGMEDAERTRAGDAVNRVRDLNIKAVQVGNLSTPINEVLMGLVVFGVIVYGGYRIAGGILTPGELLSFIAAFGLAYEPMKKLAKLNNALQLGVGAAERIREMFAVKTLIHDPAVTRSLNASRPVILFRDVHFSYDENDAPALRNVSFVAEAGKTTALVGPSGGGKSTILNMILRFYDPQTGVVTINGTDIRDVALKDLRKNIALVSQDVTIFNDTVLSNICYGSQASEADVIQAAKDSAADDFIKNLPDGYHTVLGEHGVRLSGGQKQRLSLARAMLRKAPILLLDEATSALDNESERAVQTALAALKQNCTTLVIAHRLTTVQNADHIIVIDKGVVVESGIHDDLMARGGIYARLYHAGLQE